MLEVQEGFKVTKLHHARAEAATDEDDARAFFEFERSGGRGEGGEENKKKESHWEEHFLGW